MKTTFKQNRRAALTILKPDRFKRNRKLFPLVTAHPVSGGERDLFSLIRLCADPFAGTVLDPSAPVAALAPHREASDSHATGEQDDSQGRTLLLGAAAQSVLANTHARPRPMALGSEIKPRPVTDMPGLSSDRITVLLDYIMARAKASAQQTEPSVHLPLSTGNPMDSKEQILKPLSRPAMSFLQPSERTRSTVEGLEKTSSVLTRQAVEGNSKVRVQRLSFSDVPPAPVNQRLFKDKWAGEKVSPPHSMPDPADAAKRFSEFTLAKRLRTADFSPASPEITEAGLMNIEERLVHTAGIILEACFRSSCSAHGLSDHREAIQESPGIHSTVLGSRSLGRVPASGPPIVKPPLKPLAEPLISLPALKQLTRIDPPGSRDGRNTTMELHRVQNGISSTATDEQVHAETRPDRQGPEASFPGITGPGGNLRSHNPSTPAASGRFTWFDGSIDDSDPVSRSPVGGPDVVSHVRTKGPQGHGTGPDEPVRWLDDDELGKRVSQILRRQARRRGVELP